MSALTQARKHASAARAALQTSLLKWSPDYVSAAHELDKASAAFKLAGEPREAAAAAEQAAEAHLKSGHGGEVGAARSLERAGELLAEHGAAVAAASSIAEGVQDLERAAALLERAKLLYREGGEAAKAASCGSARGKALSAAAEALPEGHARREALLADALESFLGACAILEDAGRVAFSLDTFRHALNQTVKQRRWADAIRVADKMLAPLAQLKQKSAVHKMRLTKVVLSLKRNDLAGARNAFRDGFDDPDYLRSDECAAAEDLVRAWEMGDEAAVRELVTTRQVFNFLERQVSVCARDLSPYTSAPERPSAQAAPAPLAVPVPAAKELAAQPIKMEPPLPPTVPTAAPRDARDALFAKRPAGASTAAGGASSGVGTAHAKDAAAAPRADDRDSLFAKSNAAAVTAPSASSGSPAPTPAPLSGPAALAVDLAAASLGNTAPVVALPSPAAAAQVGVDDTGQDDDPDLDSLR
jgi:hypothetical protein